MPSAPHELYPEIVQQAICWPASLLLRVVMNVAHSISVDSLDGSIQASNCVNCGINRFHIRSS